MSFIVQRMDKQWRIAVPEVLATNWALTFFLVRRMDKKQSNAVQELGVRLSGFPIIFAHSCTTRNCSGAASRINAARGASSIKLENKRAHTSCPIEVWPKKAPR